MLALLRQINWVSVIPHIVVLVGLALLFGLIGMSWDIAVLMAAMLYLGLAVVLQNLIPADHRRGMQAFKKADYSTAKEAFEDSYNFFQKKEWLDKYRSLFMLSVSKMSYKEIALVNMALCDLQAGKMQDARAGYERVLKEFPDSKMAKEAIDYIDNPEEEEEEEEDLTL
jgi:tetratricopeptide (TPR) repeat protein